MAVVSHQILPILNSQLLIFLHKIAQRSWIFDALTSNIKDKRN